MCSKAAPNHGGVWGPVPSDSARNPFTAQAVSGALEPSHPGQVQHQLDDAEQRQREHHREQDAQDDKVAGLAVGKVAGAVLAALYAEGGGNHAVQHLPEGGGLGGWIAHDCLSRGNLYAA